MFDKEFRKMDKALDESFKIDIFPKSKKKKFPSPKPRYTKKNKPIMTKKDQETAKKIIQETGSAFGSLVSKIKNRKIRKLEKEALKQKTKAEALAHEIKTKQVIIDSNIDIQRYEKELEKTNQELETQNKPKEDHSIPCKEFQAIDENNSCICGVRSS